MLIFVGVADHRAIIGSALAVITYYLGAGSGKTKVGRKQKASSELEARS